MSFTKSAFESTDFCAEPDFSDHTKIVVFSETPDVEDFAALKHDFYSDHGQNQNQANLNIPELENFDSTSQDFSIFSDQNLEQTSPAQASHLPTDDCSSNKRNS